MAVKVLQTDLFEEVGLEGIILQLLNNRWLLTLLKEKENIIACIQSPPVFVDRRKSAQNQHRQIQYIQTFKPQYLEGNFIKKEKHFKEVIDILIENNDNGSFNYFIAPNIRNQIKHPLFMDFKFSKCLYIYIIVFQSNNNRIRKKGLFFSNLDQKSLTQLFGQSKLIVIKRKFLDETQFENLKSLHKIILQSIINYYK
ncbi:unnamed protein product [Paramecium sonneborni]|uniref:Uncharacterized protein n=1 Tax=Paramecium sonneborni TaxID=65129 RepID=A0A8S1KTQ3_9CILI|nr:unnamed protein product [Paramecium sonneborni]